jgi:hypothetical protein
MTPEESTSSGPAAPEVAIGTRVGHLMGVHASRSGRPLPVRVGEFVRFGVAFHVASPLSITGFRENCGVRSARSPLKMVMDRGQSEAGDDDPRRGRIATWGYRGGDNPEAHCRAGKRGPELTGGCVIRDSWSPIGRPAAQGKSGVRDSCLNRSEGRTWR